MHPGCCVLTTPCRGRDTGASGWWWEWRPVLCETKSVVYKVITTLARTVCPRLVERRGRGCGCEERTKRTKTRTCSAKTLHVGATAEFQFPLPPHVSTTPLTPYYVSPPFRARLTPNFIQATQTISRMYQYLAHANRTISE